MKLLLSFVTLIITNSAYAFVGGPSVLGPNQSSLTAGYQSERGKIEPNENRASYQDAKIDIFKLKYAHGFENILSFVRSSISIEYGDFSSVEEKVGANLFYNQDKGNFLVINFAADLLHEPDKQFGFYIQATPLREYNKLKFSNPRLDTFAIGLTSAFNISDRLFQRSLIQYGSGDGIAQNSSLAVDTGFGYRVSYFANNPLTLSASLFIEADTNQRTDAAYDAAFSPAGTQDRIRAFKYGTVTGFDLALTQKSSINFSHLQKLGGYDARATQVTNLNFAIQF